MPINKQIFDERLKKPSDNSVIEINDIINLLGAKILDTVNKALTKKEAEGKKVKVAISIIARDEFGGVIDLLQE